MGHGYLGPHAHPLPPQPPAGDLANLDGLDAESAAKLPTVRALRDALYSPDFRAFVSAVTGCGELSDRTDCACNVHARGGHLLCHDDVIGTRAVSFIIYLTDPERPWKAENGGLLELYPQDPGRAAMLCVCAQWGAHLGGVVIAGCSEGLG